MTIATDETTTATAPEPAPQLKPSPEQNGQVIPSDPLLDDLRWKADRLKAIQDRNREVCELQINHLHKAEDAKQAKKAWEAAAEQLSRLIALADERLPLFDATTDEKPPEDWRDVDIDAIGFHGVSEAVINRLEEAGVATIGDLSDYTGGFGKSVSTPRPLTGIKGIGEAKAEKIMIALAAFWEAWTNGSKPKTNGEALSAAQQETDL